MTERVPGGGRVRYQPGTVSGGTPGRWSRALSHATAPFGGSRFLFPARLAAVLDPARRDAACRSVSSTHARWFFGDSLVLWTDPQKLSERLLDRVRGNGRDVRLAERFLDGGDWGDVIVPADTAESRETAELVQYRTDYPEMPTFRTMLARIRKGGRVGRYRQVIDSEEKLHAYFRYFLELTERIESQGFREQSALGPTEDPLGRAVRGRYADRQRDIGAAVDERGRLLRFLGGRHRTAIAQALKLPVVPVEIRIVHADWLAEECRRTALPPVDALPRWAARVSLRA